VALDTADAYQEARVSLCALLGGSSAQELARTVPATPLWTVTDVVRHLVGIADDIVEGRLPASFDPAEQWQTPEGARTGDAFTATHLEARRDRQLGSLIDEWEAVSARLDPILRGQQAAPNAVMFIEVMPVSDLAVHSQDIRGALRTPGDRESAAARIALASYAGGLALRLIARDMPALRIRYDGRERIVGSGEVAATWCGDRFEVLRALSGRRTRAQIVAMDWEGDPEPFLPLIPAYGERADTLVE
jgi:uncharacterized protein (TIGR03083 family)